MQYSAYAGPIGQRPFRLDAENDRQALEEAIRLDEEVHVVVRWAPGKKGAEIFKDWQRPLDLEHPVFTTLT